MEKQKNKEEKIKKNTAAQTEESSTESNKTSVQEMTEEERKREDGQQYWFVIRELTGRELKRRYARSKLGVAWSVLNPLLTMAVLSLIFSYMFRRAIENYPIYYLCGYVNWALFLNATNAGMTALVDNRMMLIKIKLPMDIFILSRVYTAIVNFLYSMIAFAAMLIIFRIHVTATILLFPLLVILLSLFSIGISYILACAFVFYGDVRHLWSVITTLLMYLCAIFYPIDLLPPYLQKVLGFNPVFLFIDSTRHLFLWGDIPPAGEILKIVIFSILFFVAGKRMLDKNRNRIMQKL